MSSFEKFVGQTSKNIQDVRKVCLEMTLCVFAWFVDLYVFVLDEIDVEGNKLVYKHIWIGKVWVKNPRDQERVLEE